MIEFKLSKEAELEILTITLNDRQLYIDPGYVRTMQGQFHFIKELSKSETIIKYYKYGANSLIPKIKGSGKISLKGILGHFNIIDLELKKNHQLICNKATFVASEESVEITPKLNLELQRLLSSLPICNYHLSGKGKIVLYSTGPIECIELDNEKLSVYSGQIIAYSEGLKVSQAVSSDGFWGLTKRNKTIINFFGKGVVYLVTHHNKDYMLANRTTNA